MSRGVGSREERPQRNSKASGSGGWGVGVGGRESRLHQDEDGWRRPLAFGSTEYKEESANKVPSERVSCPREVFLVYAGAMESNTAEVLWMPPKWTQMLHGSSMESDQGCCAVCGESRTHGAKRGG